MSNCDKIHAFGNRKLSNIQRPDLQLRIGQNSGSGSVIRGTGFGIADLGFQKKIGLGVLLGSYKSGWGKGFEKIFGLGGWEV